jgi:hypothetical protein
MYDQYEKYGGNQNLIKAEQHAVVGTRDQLDMALYVTKPEVLRRAAKTA